MTLTVAKRKKENKYLSPCHFVQHKSYVDRPGIEPKPLRRQAMNQLPEPLHGQNFNVHHICISCCMFSRAELFLRIATYLVMECVLP
jgi:hypothetical protein